MRLLLCLAFFQLLFSCTSPPPPLEVPEDQRTAELSFRRMANHGAMEPVLEVGQEINDWRFRVIHIDVTKLENGGTSYDYHLADNSGIKYRLDQDSNRWLSDVAYGEILTVSGEIVSLERDLAAGTMSVVLHVTHSN